MKSQSSSDDEKDREIIRLLEELGSIKSPYPPELLRARRASFLAQVEQLTSTNTGEEWSAGDREVLRLLGRLKSAEVEYPAKLLAARRSVFLRQMESTRGISVWDRLRLPIQSLFSSQTTTPTAALPSFMRISLVIATLVAAALIGTLFFGESEQSLNLAPSQAAVAPTHLLPTSPDEVALLICTPGATAPSCASGELDPDEDLADPRNGPALPAVSKDARSNQDGVHSAAYVNDGRGGASWVSDSLDSWIKIDLGTVRTINTVSLRKGGLGSSYDDDPGQFVIEVALSDMYADGDSSNDSMEYTPVFRSEQTGFSGMVSQAEALEIQFPPVKARFVKITFEKPGAAIEEVGVYMVQPPEWAGQSTNTPHVDGPGITVTPVNTLLAMDTATSVAADTPLATNTATSVPTATGTSTTTALPTNTLPPTATPTLVFINPSPTDTPVPPVIEPSPTSPETIRVTGNNQTLTFTCNGNAVEVRGHANTVTLLGSCSSITVTGNRNQVFWESGSPIITDRGKDNLILQQ